MSDIDFITFNFSSTNFDYYLVFSAVIAAQSAYNSNYDHWFSFHSEAELKSRKRENKKSKQAIALREKSNELTPLPRNIFRFSSSMHEKTDLQE